MWRAPSPPAFRAVTHCAAALGLVCLRPKEALITSLFLSRALHALAIKTTWGDKEDSAPAACCCPVPIEAEETSAGAEDTSETVETAETEESREALSASPARFESCASHPSRPLVRRQAPSVLAAV